jgi:HEAT repeat protein
VSRGGGGSGGDGGAGGGGAGRGSGGAVAGRGGAVAGSGSGDGAAASARQLLVRDVSRGEDFFRSSVIEALGDYKAAYAFDAIVAVSKLDGPLQEDAALALGKIGDKRALDTLAELQRTARRQVQPSIAAAICLLGVNCSSHENYLVEVLKFSGKNTGYQELLRAAAAALGALGVNGHQEAAASLFDIGIPARDDATRAPVALALGTVALRNTALMMTLLEQYSDREAAVSLLAEGFDMLEEDLDKERFFAAARRTYWESQDQARRALMQALIGKLDF